MLLVALRKASGAGIVQAILKGVDETYVLGFWRLIMLLVRAIPEGIFKRMRL